MSSQAGSQECGAASGQRWSEKCQQLQTEIKQQARPSLRADGFQILAI